MLWKTWSDATWISQCRCRIRQLRFSDPINSNIRQTASRTVLTLTSHRWTVVQDSVDFLSFFLSWQTNVSTLGVCWRLMQTSSNAGRRFQLLSNRFRQRSALFLSFVDAPLAVLPIWFAHARTTARVSSSSRGGGGVALLRAIGAPLPPSRLLIGVSTRLVVHGDAVDCQTRLWPPLLRSRHLWPWTAVNCMDDGQLRQRKTG